MFLFVLGCLFLLAGRVLVAHIPRLADAVRK